VAAHPDHHTVTDLAIQAALVLFMAALLVNVIVSVVAILRERDAPEPVKHRASRLASKLESQRRARAAAAATAPAGSEPRSERVTARQALSEG
jgi:hypothetical protein